MSRRFPSLPAGFSWLIPSCRPSRKEVNAYAHAIAAAEGYPPDVAAARLQREAELQLWIWRSEKQRAARRGRLSHAFIDSPRFVI